MNGESKKQDGGDPIHELQISHHDWIVVDMKHPTPKIEVVSRDQRFRLQRKKTAEAAN